MDGRRTLVEATIGLIACLGFSVMGAAGDLAPEPGPVATNAVPITESPTTNSRSPAATPHAPWVSSTVPGNVRDKLEAGFELALQRVSEIPECGELFDDLGAHGATVLGEALYYPAALKQELQLCRGVLAFTVPEVRPTWLCRRFAGLSNERAATVLLHEALHSCGMKESHRDKTLLSPRAIDKLVKNACRL